MIEFKVNGDLAKIQSSDIDANFAELNRWLEGELSIYKNMVVLPENISEAKADRAKIRKQQARIDELRKMVKKAYLAPYERFAEKCKTPLELCQSVADHIDQQIKEYETTEKEAKKKELEAYFSEKCNDAQISSYLSWGLVYNPRWLNATYSIEKAKTDIDDRINSTLTDIEVIRAQEEKYVPMLLNYYSRGSGLAEVLKVLESFRKTEREEAERKSKLEQEKAQREATRKAKEAALEKAESHANATSIDTPAQTLEPELIRLGFVVTCTSDQLMSLRKFLVNNKIHYEPIGG